MTRLSTEQLESLIARLSSAPGVAALGESALAEAATTAHAILDIAESADRLLREIVPSLLRDAATGEELNDALLDFGEELRHIHYHTRDAQFFAYLVNEGGG